MTQLAMISFTVMEEVRKVVAMVTAQPPSESVICANAEFARAMADCGNEGFFFVLMPINNTLPEGIKLAYHPYNQYWKVASTFCTRDRVPGYMDTIFNNRANRNAIAPAFTAYSTPENLAILQEDRDSIRRIRKSHTV